MEFTKIIKRDNREVEFDSNKITDAIVKAAESVGGSNRLKAIELTKKVIDTYINEHPNETPTVENIQDTVEKVLIEEGHAKTAKAFILYRDERTRNRELKTNLMKTINEVTYTDSKNSDYKRENANIDADTPMGTMLKYGSTVSKEFYSNSVLKPIHAKMHREGYIHIHDFDFYTLTTTCTQIDLAKLFKNGFSTGHGHIRPPKDIATYAALTCIAIQSNQNDQHGGQSIPKFDYDLAEGVALTFRKKYYENVERGLRFNNISDDIINKIITGIKNDEFSEYELNMGDDYHKYLDDENDYVHDRMNEFMSHKYLSTYKDIAKEAYEMSIKETDRAVYQAMEALIHNLNTMQSRCGAQVPFSSINYGTDTSPEGRMIIRNVLLALDAGLGNGETPIFPIHIFKVKEGINYNPEDPNYDLFELACKVSAKRLFPNFEFIDAPFNLQYYKPGHPETEVATMGCLQKDEVVTYKFKNKLYVESISRMWTRVFIDTKKYETQGESRYINTSGIVEIYDSSKNKFVDCKKIINNPNKNNWVQLKLDNGRNLTCTLDHPLPVIKNGESVRTFVKDMNIGDKIPVTYSQYSEETVCFDDDMAWLLGVLVCDSNYDGSIVVSLGIDEMDIINKLTSIVNNKWNAWVSVKDMRIHTGENYYQVGIHTDNSSDEKIKDYCKYLLNQFGGNIKRHRQLPQNCFSWNTSARYALLGGLIDADGYCTKDSRGTRVMLGSTNKELALQEMMLVQSLGFACKMYISTYTSKHNKLRYKIEFGVNEELYKYIASNKKRVFKELNDIQTVVSADIKTPEECSIVSIEAINIDECSFDVETESDRFDASGILSHNCRTRVIGNTFDKNNEVVSGRGNLSFTTINLPRLAIEANGDVDKFFDSLNKMMDITMEQLLDRFEIQASKHVYNYPFLMGEGVWHGSEKLKPEDEVREVIKHGTLSVGFIGLAETLISLIGEHHGESERAQELGLKIIKFMRDKTDAKAKETNLNFSLLATPAEGLSGRFVKIDAKKYGIINGVTDKDYYVNSFHIPPKYNISAFNKIKLEAPYHELTNAGHISYIELDGDPTQNIPAFIQIVKCMKEFGIGYGAINHPVDRDPECGYTGIINDVCPKCGRRESEHGGCDFERIRRITGYLTNLKRTNNAKSAEIADRVKHGTN